MTATVVSPIPFEDLPQELAALLRPRYDRLGYLGDFFGCAAYQPDALAAFVRFTEAVKDALPDNIVEVIALTCASTLGNRYELHQHERLAVRLGLGRNWVAEVERLEPDVSDLDRSERGVQSYVLAALPAPGADARTRLDGLVSELGTSSTVAVALMTARFAAHAVVIASMGIEPPVPSIWEDGFVG